MAAHHAPKFPSAKSAGKVLASNFLGSRRHPPIEYLPKGQTINAEYYSSLLVQFKDLLREKRRGKFTKVVLFLHDNAPAYRALATQKTLDNLSVQCLDHPPYYPDLGPQEYHVFSALKKQLKGRNFSSDAEFIAAAETWMNGQISDFFLSNGLRSLLSFVGNMLKKFRVYSLYFVSFPFQISIYQHLSYISFLQKTYKFFHSLLTISNTIL